jgi:hypothetical protein
VTSVGTELSGDGGTVASFEAKSSRGGGKPERDLTRNGSAAKGRCLRGNRSVARGRRVKRNRQEALVRRSGLRRNSSVVMAAPECCDGLQFKRTCRDRSERDQNRINASGESPVRETHPISRETLTCRKQQCRRALATSKQACHCQGEDWGFVETSKQP